MIFKGTTSGSIFSAEMQSGGKITSYTLVNKTGGAITAEVAIVEPNVSTVHINSQSIAANEQYSTDVAISIRRGWYILIIVGGSCDFYFNID